MQFIVSGAEQDARIRVDRTFFFWLFVYRGTSRGCYNRFKQHQTAYRVKEGYMLDHAEGVYSGAVDFKYSMKAGARDSF